VTSTSAFGVGRREAHDSSPFYARFEAPEVSDDEEIAGLAGLPQGAEACVVADARRMVLPGGDRLPDASVALVVTSPPYFSGKEYEQALGFGVVPATYVEYLQMLRDVLAECKRVLEPGGRLAVNVANLGRKPYRSLAADVIRIMQDDLRLLLRGEVIWRKGEGASGSCAWGSYRSAANPVLRDLTERVIIASKGRFDRAVPTARRRAAGLPHESDLTADEFMEATLDVWSMPPESARRVGHPAPFPVELPQRLIGLYTYRDDLVVDPFMGSGSTLVAAIRAGRRFLGYDTDEAYVETARQRVADELGAPPVCVAARPCLAEAGALLDAAGFAVTGRAARQRGLGLSVDLVADDGDGRPWYFDVTGGFTTVRAGLWRTDVALRALGRATVLTARGRRPVVLLSSHLPKPGSEADLVLRAAGPGVVFDVVGISEPEGRARLAAYAASADPPAPRPGFWTGRDLGDT